MIFTKVPASLKSVMTCLPSLQTLFHIDLFAKISRLWDVLEISNMKVIDCFPFYRIVVSLFEMIWDFSYLIYAISVSLLCDTLFLSLSKYKSYVLSIIFISQVFSGERGTLWREKMKSRRGKCTEWKGRGRQRHTVCGEPVQEQPQINVWNSSAGGRNASIFVS